MSYKEQFLETGVSPIPIIDVHAHMGGVYGTSIPGGDVHGMIEVMNRENIEAIVASSHSALFDPGSGNRETEEAMALYPDRIKGYYAYNPNYEELYLKDISKAIENNGYIGFKFLPDYHGSSLSGGEYKTVLELADYYRLTVLSHTWGGSPGNAPLQAESILKRYKGIKLIMGHSAPGELDRAIELAREYENVYLDLCDIHRHSGIVEKMADKAGADKILFGTDIPWYDPNYCLGSILFADIPDGDKLKIINTNGKRLINHGGAN